MFGRRAGAGELVSGDSDDSETSAIGGGDPGVFLLAGFVRVVFGGKKG